MVWKKMALKLRITKRSLISNIKSNKSWVTKLEVWLLLASLIILQTLLNSHLRSRHKTLTITGMNLKQFNLKACHQKQHQSSILVQKHRKLPTSWHLHVLSSALLLKEQYLAIMTSHCMMLQTRILNIKKKGCRSRLLILLHSTSVEALDSQLRWPLMKTEAWSLIIVRTKHQTIRINLRCKEHMS